MVDTLVLETRPSGVGVRVSPWVLDGDMAEWLIAPVLKTGGCKSSRGSNPLVSAETEAWQSGNAAPC